MKTWDRIFLVFILGLLLAGCFPVEKPTPITPVVQTPSSPWFTEADVRVAIARLGDKVTAVTPYLDRYLLVESCNEYNDQRLRFVNLKTHDIDLLPTLPYEVKLVQIKDENHIIFEADGTTSINMFSVFPFLIECRRFVEVAGVDGEFLAFESPRYFPVSEPSSANGKGIPMFVTDMRVTMDGVGLLFGPVEGKEAEFYAATAFIPSTHIAYKQDAHELVVRLSNTAIGTALRESWNDRRLDNYYIQSCTYHERNDYTEIVVGLTDAARFYHAKVDLLDTVDNSSHPEIPVLTVLFRAFMPGTR